MKPTNRLSESCDPISSNCVIWQGNDIPCINLCKGDTVSKVVYKLATELCEILDILDVEAYDLSCFNLESCTPGDFKALLQLLIEQICAAQGIDSGSPAGSAGCPDCVVDIAPCFYYTNEAGDQQTTMQLLTYVTAIGNRICNLVSDITTLQTAVSSLNSRVTSLENRTTSVESTQASSAAGESVRSELLDDTVSVKTVLEALDPAFVELRGATGEPNDIFKGVLKQEPGIAQSDKLAGTGNIASITGWEDDPSNLGKAFGNMWLVIRDIRAAIKNIQANCCPSVCEDVAVEVSAALNGPDELILYFSGTLPSDLVECGSGNTLVTIEDSDGGKLTINVPVKTNMNDATGYSVDLTSTPVNSALNLTITSYFCFTDPDTGTECRSVGSYVLNNTSICPTVSITPSESEIDYSFNWYSEAATFDIELYDQSGTVLVASQTTSVLGASSVSDTFTGLSSATAYRLRVKVTIGSNTTTCPFGSVSTLSPSCLPPSNVDAEIIKT